MNLKKIVIKIKLFIERSLKIEKSLKKQVFDNIKTHIKIQSYKGKFFIKGLPVNGQRTKTNGKTAKKLKFFNKNE